MASPMNAIPNEINKYLSWLSINSTGSTVDHVNSTRTPLPPMFPTTTSASGSFSCYDDYYCTSQMLANVSHGLMGGLAFVIALVGLLANTIMIPVLYMEGIRSSATLHMISIAVCDAAVLFLTVIVVVVRNLSPDVVRQTVMHQHFTGYLVPFGWPLMSALELMSLLIVISLLWNRFSYAMTQRVRTRSVKPFIVGLGVLSLFLSVPHFLKFKIVEKASINGTGSVQVMHTLIARDNNWLAVASIVIRLLVYIFTVIFMALLATALVKRRASLKYHFSRQLSRDERFERRENIYSLVAFGVSVLVVLCHLPRVVISIVRATTAVTANRWEALLVGDIVADFTELFSLASKPLLYLIMGPHIRQTLHDMIGLCFKPKAYKELALAGGVGSVVDLSVPMSKGTTSNFHRSYTAQTLLNGNCDSQISRKSSTVQQEVYIKAVEYVCTSTGSSNTTLATKSSSSDSKAPLAVNDYDTIA